MTDILSRENYAIIRRFNDKRKLVFIGIWILDWSNGRDGFGLAMRQRKEGIKHWDAITTNNPFETSRIERKNNPIEANRTERNVKNGNKKFFLMRSY